MKAVILAAGYGTRMYPLTVNCAKALLPVGNKKALDYIVQKIPEEFFDEIIVVTNNRFYKDFENWEKNSGSKIKISLINDGTNSPETALGIIKDLELGLKKINTDFLVISSDNIFGFDLRKMSEQFVKFNKSPLIAVTDTKDMEKVKKHGVVELMGNKIISYEEKPVNPRTTIKVILCQMLPFSVKEVVVDLAKSGSKEYLLDKLLSKSDVFAFKFDEYCHDIGNIEDYNKICAMQLA